MLNAFEELNVHLPLHETRDVQDKYNLLDFNENRKKKGTPQDFTNSTLGYISFF